MSVEGVIFDVKRYAIHDGPGIRTTVFMKGCPLRCIWCHNPESHSLGFDIMYMEYKCIHCYTCVNVCPDRLIYFDEEDVQHIDREKCSYCGICTDNCPTTALEFVGERITVEKLMTIVERDITLYDSSGGGVTFSGGEPLMQPVFLKEALEECKRRSIHTVVDTSGYASTDVLRSIQGLVDLYLFDIKLCDSGLHKKYTGVPNEQIKRNLRFLVSTGNNVILRFPVIPTVTDTDENIECWKRFIMDLGGVREIDLLPYHDVSEKFRRLGREYLMKVHDSPSDQKMKEIKEKFEEIGLYVKIGG